MILRILTLIHVLTTLAACGPISFTVGSEPSTGIAYTVVKSGKGFAPDRVAIIDISGFLMNGSPRGLLSVGENPVSFLHERLEFAHRDDRTKAVILRLNTPGGTVTASDAMYREVRRFREMSGMPVVALMLDVAASGGYYTACAADHIVAYPTSITGSIGVIFQTVSFKPLLDRWGIHADAIVSGPNKNAGSPLDTMTDQQRAIIQAMVDDFYQRFVEVVRVNRPAIATDRFEEVTDGRIFTGAQAESLGIIDQTGDVYDAFSAAKRLAHIQDADLIALHRVGDFAPTAYAASPTSNPSVTQFNLAQFNIDGTPAGVSPSFLYLWRPADR